ncbi:MAG: hypothetical protein QM755_03445 [Luteolibacter sp.]
MKPAVLAALLLATTPLHAGEPTEASKLLDKVISAPGSYSQVCDVMMAPADLPYRAYSLSGFSGAWFSKANLAAVKADRPAIVKAIRTRLAAIDLSRKAVAPGIDKTPEESFDGDNFGCDPQSLNPLLLELIEDLDAIEALPELLVIEGKLVDGIAKAKDDASAPVPVVSGWSVGSQGPEKEIPEGLKLDRRINLFQARVAQRDLVILMAELMRNRAYAPYLSSQLEAAYAKGIKARVAKDGLSSYKPGEPLPKKLEGMEVVMDPILNVPKLSHQTVSMPYTRESRDEVLAAAEKWIAEHP